MKVAKVYFDKEFLSNKLGIESNKLIIGNVESTLNEVNITLILDDSVDIDAVNVSDTSFSGDIERRRI